MKALQPENLQSSFRRTGIYPFNPNIIDRSVFLPPTVFENVKEANDENVKEANDENVKEAKENETEEAGKNMQLKFEKSEGIKILNEAPETGNETALKFFERREDGILVRKETKKRNHIGQIVSGKPITETEVTKKIIEHKSNQTKVNFGKKCKKRENKVVKKVQISRKETNHLGQSKAWAIWYAKCSHVE